MFFHQLRSLAMLAMMIALAVAGRPDVQARELDQGGSLRVKAIRAQSDLAPSVFLPIQSKNAEKLAAGKLLVASRDLADPNFAHTVVLLVRYNADGVAGLVINRRTDLPLSQVLEGVKAAKDRSDPVYVGGPVERPSLFCLLYSQNKPEGAEHIFGGTYLIETKSLFEQIIATRPDPRDFHVYLGYAGWSKEQLRMEVAGGSWFIFPADTESVFGKDPDSLWPQLIRKTELKLARE
jgi:putative AlgH/UPF0301 family transcriptional regulator